MTANTISVNTAREAPTSQAEGLVKKFGGFTAVDGVSFETRRGECFGFLGPNGAGKTSTMRMIGCSSPVTQGRLTVLGMDVTRQARAIKAQLGVVPQIDALDEELTVVENLQVYGRYFGLSKKDSAPKVHELIDFMQLREKAQVIARYLSGGMRRRLTIARALISEPRLMILDEPTTGLDPQARHLVWEKLRKLKRQDRTLILTSHYMEEAEQLCDRLVVMEHGRIIAFGTPRALIREHVASGVVEITGADDVRRRALDLYADKVAGYEMLEEKLMFFTDDGEGLLHDLTGRGFNGAEFYYRRAGLEDVFLKLTGRSLSE